MVSPFCTIEPRKSRSVYASVCLPTKEVCTVQHFQEVFLRTHVAHLSIHREVEGIIKRYFTPLHHYPLSDITPLIVERWFHDIGRHSRTQANKSLWILRTMFEKAKDWRLFAGENPAARVKKYPRKQRTRFVTPQEMPKLMEKLADWDDVTQSVILLCILVGCRRSEALTMRWADLDFNRGLWHKPTTKTGIPHTVPIPKALLDRLAALPKTNQWVFATKKGHLSATPLFYRWEQIRQAAGLADVTIHDLRRTCASWLAMNGANLAVIGRGVLNHSSLAHTAIYARLQTDPVAKALEDNSLRMLGGG